MSEGSVFAAIFAALEPGVLAGMALIILNLVLWEKRLPWRRWGRLISYTVGTTVIWAGVGLWAAQTGDWGALGALTVVDGLAGIGVLAAWGFHAWYEHRYTNDPLLQPRTEEQGHDA